MSPVHTGAGRQRGVALITALLVVAIAAIAATTIITAGQRAMLRTQILLDSERAWWYAVGMESWGLSLLERDRQQGRTDHLGELWAMQMPPLDVGDDDLGPRGMLHGQLHDAQGRFNINNLASTDPDVLGRQAAIFRRLLACTGAADEFGADDLVNAVIDWVDADDEQRFPGGGEDLHYLSGSPPYRAANQGMASISELRAVHGVTAELYAALSPHIAALPRPSAINLNTATLPVLCALSDNPGTRANLEAFAEQRVEAPLETVQQAFQADGLFAAGDVGVDPDELSVSSQYFLARAEAFIGSGGVVLYSLLHRPDQGVPVVIRRSTAGE